MRVLFVYPNLYTQMGFNHGLAALSAVLKRAGHETRMVNLNENLPPVPTDDEIVAQVRAWRPGVIGFSCLTMQYTEALRIARLLRARAEAEGFALAPLVVGGVHPTMVPESVMADGVWDHVGVGECEDALLQLVTRVERGERPSDVPNFLSWKDGVRPSAAEQAPVSETHWIRNNVGEFPDYAALPLPDYELFDTARITAQKHGWFGLMTSRGCPYRCTYCLNHKIVDRYRDELGRGTSQLGFFRFRTPAQMMEEIRFVLARYPDVGTFILDDDLFTLNAEHAIAFSKAYKEAGFKVPWVVNSHVNRLDPVMAKAMAEGGCKILKLGIESGSERVRREILKRFMSDDDILETVRVADAVGLHSSGFVMVGLPYETHDERWQTVDLLARSLIGRFRTSIFFPFPGTESHQLSIQGGFVDPAKAGTLTDFTASSCLDFGADENLFVEKLATCMPWFVNARAARHHEFPAARRYQPIVTEVLALDRAGWEAFKPRVRELDREVAAAAARARELHYSIRFNAFMGVRSDFYLAEEAGVEWLTAAAKPVPERLRALALAAAAEEVC
ncbi:MAG: B12-binding domain-containing radical SAM protein [Planctomycetes bacterium]|nr:B12-binding domain-containing radical SAM protein [Planctomycetota bacterium]